MMTSEEIQEALRRVRSASGRDPDMALYRLRAINTTLQKHTEDLRYRVVQQTEKKLRQGRIDPKTVEVIHAIGRQQRDIACQVAREQIRELLRQLNRRGES